MNEFPLDPNQQPDLADFIAALNTARVDYVIVGAYAVMAHTQTFRATKDLDVFVDATEDNLARLKTALSAFGAPSNIVNIGHETTAGTFDGFTFGRPPSRIDVLTRMALAYEAIHSRATSFPHAVLTNVNVIGRDDLIELKRVAGRTQDKHDLATLVPSTSRQSSKQAARPRPSRR